MNIIEGGQEIRFVVEGNLFLHSSVQVNGIPEKSRKEGNERI